MLYNLRQMNKIVLHLIRMDQPCRRCPKDRDSLMHLLAIKQIREEEQD